MYRLWSNVISLHIFTSHEGQLGKLHWDMCPLSVSLLFVVIKCTFPEIKKVSDEN